MIIYNNIVLNNARGIKKAFADMGRDYFPIEVYEWIYDYHQDYNDNDKLDVIAWCCDITSTTLDEWNDYNDKKVFSIRGLVKKLEYETTVIHYDNNEVWHIAY